MPQYDVSHDELFVRYALFDTSLVEDDILVPGDDGTETLLRGTNAWLRAEYFAFALAHPRFGKHKTPAALGVLQDPDVPPLQKISQLEHMEVLTPHSLRLLREKCGAILDNYARPPSGKRLRTATSC